MLGTSTDPSFVMNNTFSLCMAQALSCRHRHTLWAWILL